MSEVVTKPQTSARLPVGQIAFLTLLFLAGVGLLGWMLFRPVESATAPQSAGDADVARDAQAYLLSRNVKPLSEPLDKLLANTAEPLVPAQGHPLLGKPAPLFELTDHRLQSWRLADQLAKGPVVVVFYYGYFCNHCVGQLFALNADIALFHELHAEVVAISPDSAALTEQRYRQYGAFAFPVLSDPRNKIAQSYGVFTPATEKKTSDLQHGTFVIGRDGIVSWAQYGDEPFTGNRTLLHELARLEKRLPQSRK